MNDRIFGSITFLLSLFYIYSAFIIEESFIQDPVGPKTFPYIIAFFLLVSSLILIFKPEPRPEWPEFGKIVEVLVTAIVLILYAIILPIVGFVITTFLLATIPSIPTPDCSVTFLDSRKLKFFNSAAYTRLLAIGC